MATAGAHHGRGRWLPLAVALAALLPGSAQAFTVTITAGTRTIYLQVGVGTFTGTLQGGGTPGVNATTNVVSVSVPAAQVGTGAAQAMSTDSTAARSYWDNFTFCSPPAQLYVGGFYRVPSGSTGAVASLTASVPSTLDNGSGGTISFSQVSWTSSGIGDTGAQPFPAGTFAAGSTQTIGTIARNQWAESCLTFSYANTAVVPPGTYTGIVTYTLTAP
jgi:hypothetical protein